MSTRRAIILPGASYQATHPLLYYARAVLESHGWEVIAAEWPTGEKATRDPDAMVNEVAARHLDAAGDARLLVVGKSIGSLAIPAAAERAIPGVWLTPLVRRPTVAEALQRLPDPTLLIGSRSDDTWDGEVARRSNHDVLELADANHGLELGGDPLGSIDTLRQVIEAIDRLVERLDRDA